MNDIDVTAKRMAKKADAIKKAAAFTEKKRLEKEAKQGSPFLEVINGAVYMKADRKNELNRLNNAFLTFEKGE